MKQLKTLLILLVGTLIIIACKQEPQKETAEPEEHIEVSSTEDPIQQDNNVVFQKTLALQNISFDIKSTGEGSIGELTIQPKGLANDNQKITLELDGKVSNAEIEDLNSDGFPEILIYTVSAGSGSYGNVIPQNVCQKYSRCFPR